VRRRDAVPVRSYEVRYDPRPGGGFVVVVRELPGRTPLNPSRASRVTAAIRALCERWLARGETPPPEFVARL